MNATSQPASSVRLPSTYLPHGAGPCFFMDWNPPDTWQRMGDYLRSLLATLPQRPRGIVLVSAHWLADAFTVTGHPQPSLLYDYSGFPAHTYDLDYPAAGDPALAAEVVDRLQAAGLPANVDADRGFDHGVFIPMKLVAPKADIPIVQLSLSNTLDADLHLRAGAALADLRDAGIWIVGSGMSFHNMRGYGNPAFAPVSDTFDHWLTDAVQAEPARRNILLREWETAPAARLSHPPRAEEHLLPLHVIAGAAGDATGHKTFSDRVLHTTISAFQFGS